MNDDDQHEDDEEERFIEVTASIEIDPDEPWEERCPVCNGELFFHDIEPGEVLVLECRNCNGITRPSWALPREAIVPFDDESHRYN